MGPKRLRKGRRRGKEGRARRLGAWWAARPATLAPRRARGAALPCGHCDLGRASTGVRERERGDGGFPGLEIQGAGRGFARATARAVAFRSRILGPQCPASVCRPRPLRFRRLDSLNRGLKQDCLPPALDAPPPWAFLSSHFLTEEGAGQL